MLCKTLQSEYMKRFKGPHWEAYKSCYEEMLKYRLARRLLEQAHDPWLWEGWDRSSDSSSGCFTPPLVAATPTAPDPTQKLAAAGPEEETEATMRQNGIGDQTTHNDVPRSGNDPLRQENNQDGEKKTQSNEKSASHSRPLQSHGASSKQNTQKVDAGPPNIGAAKEIQHAFVLYASGERKKDTGSQKTHNVCAPAQEHEIHESALKAKNRRQREKRKQLLQKQRARSADAERVLRRIPSPVDNPWVTEYMRCYSARAR